MIRNDLILKYKTIIQDISNVASLNIVFNELQHCNGYQYGLKNKIVIKCSDFNLEGHVVSMPGFCGACVIYTVSLMTNSEDMSRLSEKLYFSFYNFLLDISYLDGYRCAILTDTVEGFEKNKKYIGIKELLQEFHSFTNKRSLRDVSMRYISLDDRKIIE